MPNLMNHPRSASPCLAGICQITAVLMVLGLSGCGNSGPTAHDFSGTATFAGSPIVYGNVTFIPDSSKDHEGPAGEAEIVDGKFDTSANGKGIFPGPHIARVTAYEQRPPESDDETVETESAPPLFMGYEIEVDIQPEQPVTLEVPESARGYSMFGSSRPSGNIP